MVVVEQVYTALKSLLLLLHRVKVVQLLLQTVQVELVQQMPGLALGIQD